MTESVDKILETKKGKGMAVGFLIVLGALGGGSPFILSGSNDYAELKKQIENVDKKVDGLQDDVDANKSAVQVLTANVQNQKESLQDISLQLKENSKILNQIYGSIKRKEDGA